MEGFIAKELLGLIPFFFIVVGLAFAPFTQLTKLKIAGSFWIAWTIGVLLFS